MKVSKPDVNSFLAGAGKPAGKTPATPTGLVIEDRKLASWRLPVSLLDQLADLAHRESRRTGKRVSQESIVERSLRREILENVNES